MLHTSIATTVMVYCLLQNVNIHIQYVSSDDHFLAQCFDSKVFFIGVCMVV